MRVSRPRPAVAHVTTHIGPGRECRTFDVATPSCGGAAHVGRCQVSPGSQLAASKLKIMALSAAAQVNNCRGQNKTAIARCGWAGTHSNHPVGWRSQKLPSRRTTMEGRAR